MSKSEFGCKPSRALSHSRSHYIPTLQSLLSVSPPIILGPSQPLCSHPLAMRVEWCSLQRPFDQFCYKHGSLRREAASLACSDWFFVLLAWKRGTVLSRPGRVKLRRSCFTLWHNKHSSLNESVWGGGEGV